MASNRASGIGGHPSPGKGQDVNHSSRINDALAFIESNLEQDISLNSVARSVGLSTFHFHRIFSALVGRSFMTHVEARRLAHAAHELCGSRQKIVDVAFRYGYGSHEAFSRAFRREFGVSPTHFRKSMASYEVDAPLLVGQLDVLLSRGQVVPAPEFSWSDPFSVAGIACRSRDADELNTVWERFWQRARAAGIADLHNRFFGVCQHPADSQDPGMFDYVAGVLVEDTDEPFPADFGIMQVPACRIAWFEHHGSIDQIGQTYDRIYTHWLPHTSVVPSIGLDVLVIDENFNGDSPDSRIGIWIAIDNKKSKEDQEDGL